MSGNPGPTRVVIIEDHTLFAESLDVALTLEGHEVRRTNLDDGHRSASAIVAAVQRQRARVVILDLGLGAAGSGVPLVAPLSRGSAVVVVTASSDRVVWGECLRAGASTVLSKSQPLDAILVAIRHLEQGRAVLSRPDRELMMSELVRDRSERRRLRARLDALTPRERQVLAHLMHGRAVREIALLGVVSEATVRTQVKSILAKLEVSSQLAAVGLAHRATGPGPTHEVVA